MSAEDSAAPTPVPTAFSQFSGGNLKALLALRDMIFQVASADSRIGPLEETLRWGEPAYVTAETKAGSVIRLGVEKQSGQPALFFNCNTTLVEEFRQRFGSQLAYSKNRAVVVGCGDGLPTDALKACIFAALTYHLRGKK